MANVVKIVADHSNPNIYRSGTALQTQTCLAIFSAFTLTLITTFLISYRIITVTQQTNLPKRSRNTYTGIVDIIAQSSALYSVVLLIWAITWVVTPKSDLRDQISFNYIAMFSEELAFLAAGIAPTVMVARIARVSSTDLHRQSVTAHISDLEFQVTGRDRTISMPAVAKRDRHAWIALGARRVYRAMRMTRRAPSTADLISYASLPSMRTHPRLSASSYRIASCFLAVSRYTRVTLSAPHVSSADATTLRPVSRRCTPVRRAVRRNLVSGRPAASATAQCTYPPALTSHKPDAPWTPTSRPAMRRVGRAVRRARCIVACLPALESCMRASTANFPVRRIRRAAAPAAAPAIITLGGQRTSPIRITPYEQGGNSRKEARRKGSRDAESGAAAFVAGKKDKGQGRERVHGGGGAGAGDGEEQQQRALTEDVS
ncbi:hypothetical protein HYPSUDRAFT_206219 [Hypholoma sublateritium FD-334 SS-4]|uniref:Uncharacterized protein n=1 Tax=Hypholoma sublateritium (strain FD-334 SS-4) TaxID=945553 RepID=A0A0D2NL95_HYPSF|nr:hypothetical protein HYPSUDRAFT_206219 [Hypholoma sublateritium FD-334 SS-4]